MSDLVEKLRKAADWGEDEFDVLSPQDAAAAAPQYYRNGQLQASGFCGSGMSCAVFNPFDYVARFETAGA
jgi:hypothetical protein